MTGTSAGRHARRGHAARKLIMALGLTAGIAIAAGASAAAVVTLASAPASVTVPSPEAHAAAPANYAPVAVPPVPHERAEAVYVTVRPGDCLWSIAAAHGISWRALYRANRHAVGSDPGLIYPGTRLRVPARK